MKNNIVWKREINRRPLIGKATACRGFTLTELLVCIAIVGILLAISFPAAQAIRQGARRAYCLNNLKPVMLANLSYESKGTGFPPGDGGRGQSFIVSLLPYLEEEQLSERSKENWAFGETSSDRWSELSQQQVVPLICPAASPDDVRATLTNQGEFTSHYYGIAGPVGTAQDHETSQLYSYQGFEPPLNGPIGLQGIFSPRANGEFVPKRIQDVTDGISNTFGIGEISRVEPTEAAEMPLRSGWAFGVGYDARKKLTNLYSIKSISRPINRASKTLNDIPFASNHFGGTQFALLDGSVHFVSQNASVDVLKTYASINEREKVQSLDEQ